MDFENLSLPTLWLIAGVILCAAEMLVPGIFLLWLGIAALVTGVIAWALPIGPVLQILVFGVLAIASIYAGRRWTRSDAIASTDPLLNDRLARMVGQNVVLVTAISGGAGRAKVGDGVWDVRGEDQPAGSQMVITGNKDGVLTVEPYQSV
jgi:inner membrane protein